MCFLFSCRNSSAIKAPLMLIPNDSDKYPQAKCYATCHNYSIQHRTNRYFRLKFWEHKMPVFTGLRLTVEYNWRQRCSHMPYWYSGGIFLPLQDPTPREQRDACIHNIIWNSLVNLISPTSHYYINGNSLSLSPHFLSLDNFHIIQTQCSINLHFLFKPELPIL